MPLGQIHRPYHYESVGKKSGNSGTITVNSAGEWTICLNNSPPEDTVPFNDEGAAVTVLHDCTGEKPSKVYDDEGTAKNS